MYIAVNETPMRGRDVLRALPSSIRRYMCNVNTDEALEIRLIAGRPFTIRYPDGDYYLTPRSVLSNNRKGALIVTAGQIEEALERITNSSLYSVRDEIKNGYITIEGGHRVGLAGTAVTENGETEFIKNISAMNIRIANEIKGAADSVMGAVMQGREVLNTLIVSPPCAGKTTLLRDIVRQLSENRFSVAVADERCEIAAMYNGRSGFDLGPSAAVMDNCPKDRAMLMLLRSMSPDVIVTDEIGTEADVNAISSIINSGVAVIASIHGRDRAQLMRRRNLRELINMFDSIIVLSKRNGVGTVEEIKKCSEWQAQ